MPPLASFNYSTTDLYVGCGMVLLIPFLLALGIVLHLREAFSSHGGSSRTYLVAVLLSLLSLALAIHLYREAGPRPLRRLPRVFFTLATINVVLLPLTTAIRWLRFRTPR